MGFSCRSVIGQENICVPQKWEEWKQGFLYRTNDRCGWLRHSQPANLIKILTSKHFMITKLQDKVQHYTVLTVSHRWAVSMAMIYVKWYKQLWDLLINNVLPVHTDNHFPYSFLYSPQPGSYQSEWLCAPQNTDGRLRQNSWYVVVEDILEIIYN